MRHAVSVDVEDYRQILSQRLKGTPGPVSRAFERDMDLVLSLLDEARTSATFFVTGTVAEKRPDMLRRWASAGHEIASHGHSHTPVWMLPPKALKGELQRSKSTIEDAIGESVKGYRAPIFSVRWDTLWALDVIRECGFTYDSSVVPVRMRRYGIKGFHPLPAVYELPSGQSVVEIPLTIARIWGMRVPVAGGGYFRLFPRQSILNAVRECGRRGEPFVMYCHPYEFGSRLSPCLDLATDWRSRLSVFTTHLKTSVGRRDVPGLVELILREQRFSVLGRLAERTMESGQPRVLATTR